MTYFAFHSGAPGYCDDTYGPQPLSLPSAAAAAIAAAADLAAVLPANRSCGGAGGAMPASYVKPFLYVKGRGSACHDLQNSSVHMETHSSTHHVVGVVCQRPADRIFSLEALGGSTCCNELPSVHAAGEQVCYVMRTTDDPGWPGLLSLETASDTNGCTALT